MRNAKITNILPIAILAVIAFGAAGCEYYQSPKGLTDRTISNETDLQRTESAATSEIEKQIQDLKDQLASAGTKDDGTKALEDKIAELEQQIEDLKNQGAAEHAPVDKGLKLSPGNGLIHEVEEGPSNIADVYKAEKSEALETEEASPPEDLVDAKDTEAPKVVLVKEISPSTIRVRFSKDMDVISVNAYKITVHYTNTRATRLSDDKVKDVIAYAVQNQSIVDSDEFNYFVMGPNHLGNFMAGSDANWKVTSVTIPGRVEDLLGNKLGDGTFQGSCRLALSRQLS